MLHYLLTYQDLIVGEVFSCQLTGMFKGILHLAPFLRYCASKILVFDFDPSGLPRVDYLKYLFFKGHMQLYIKIFLTRTLSGIIFKIGISLLSFRFMTLTLRGHRRLNILVFFGQAI